jgi:hypothetical protein
LLWGCDLVFSVCSIDQDHHTPPDDRDVEVGAEATTALAPEDQSAWRRPCVRHLADMGTDLANLVHRMTLRRGVRAEANAEATDAEFAGALEQIARCTGVYSRASRAAGHMVEIDIKLERGPADAAGRADRASGRKAKPPAENAERQHLRRLVTDQIRNFAAPQDAERVTEAFEAELANPALETELDTLAICMVADNICKRLGISACFEGYTDAELGLQWDPTETDRVHCQKHGIEYPGPVPEQDPNLPPGFSRLPRGVYKRPPTPTFSLGLQPSLLPKLPTGFIGPNGTIVPPPEGYSLGPEPADGG